VEKGAETVNSIERAREREKEKPQESRRDERVV